MIGLTARDISCPVCDKPRDVTCFPRAPRFHQERCNAAAAITREINRVAREKIPSKRL